MIKFSFLFCVAVLACAATPAARTGTLPSEPCWNPDETAPTVHDVASAAARARTTHCQTSSCKAIIVIHELSDILHREYGSANDAGRLANRPQIAGWRLDRTLLDHPELCGPVCAMAVKLVFRVHLDPDTNEILIPAMLPMHGVDMDLRDHGHCARDLMAALPRGPANDAIRFNAQESCAEGDENHYRPQAACAVLAEDVREKR